MWVSWLLLSNALCEHASRNISEFIQICDASDKEINECARAALQGIFHTLSNKGLPQYRLPHLEPLLVDQMTLDQGMGLNGFIANLTDTKHIGYSTTKVLSARVRPKSYRMEFELFIPEYHVRGTYEIDGRILLLPIFGSGPINISVYDSKEKWIIDGRPVVRNNVTYMDLKRFQIRWKSEKASFYLGNLFNGGTYLGYLNGDRMNSYLNNNHKSVIAQMLPSVETAFGNIFFRVAKKFFDTVPYNQLFYGL